MLRALNGRAGVLRLVHADDPDRTGGPDHADQRVQDHAEVFLPDGVVRPVADSFHDAVEPEPVGDVQDRLDHLLVGPVHGGHPDPLGQRQPVRMKVHQERLQGTTKVGAESGHQTDRAGAEDGHRLARLRTGELGAVVAGREDVRQQGEVSLPVRAVGSSSRLKSAHGTRSSSAWPPQYGPIIGQP